MKTLEDYYREGYAAHTWYLASCPYVRADIRNAWQAGAWAWASEQRKAHDNERRYRIDWISERDYGLGKRDVAVPGPFTHREACVVLTKLVPHKHLRYLLVEVS